MICWAADLHLGANIRQNCLETSLDGFAALENLAALLTKRGDIKDLVLAGDIFDEKSVDGLEIKAFRQFMDTMILNGIRVYSIQGNHDKGRNSIAESLGAVSLNRKLTRIHGLDVYGIDFCGIDELRQALEDAPACDVLVLHQAFEHLLGFDGAFHVRLEEIPAKLRNVVVGDIHKSDASRLPNSSGLCLSPGSLHPTKVDEDAPRGVWIWTPGNTPVFQQIQNRPIYRCNLERERDLPELRKKLEKPHRLLPLVELQRTAEKTPLAEKLKLEYETKALFVERPISTAAVESGGLDKELNERMSLDEALPFAVDPDKEREVFHVLHELLLSEEPGKALELLVEELEGVER